MGLNSAFKGLKVCKCDTKMADLKFINIIPFREDWRKMRNLEILRDSVSARKTWQMLYKERWKLQTRWVTIHKVYKPYLLEDSENFEELHIS
jgi:hypothetical protein